MFCKYCGAEIPDTAIFCRNCGAKAEDQNSAFGNQNIQRENTQNNFSNQNIPYRQPFDFEAKKQNATNPVIIILIIALIAGISVNILQLHNGTHVFSGKSSKLSSFSELDPCSIIQVDFKINNNANSGCFLV